MGFTTRTVPYYLLAWDLLTGNGVQFLFFFSFIRFQQGAAELTVGTLLSKIPSVRVIVTGCKEYGPGVGTSRLGFLIYIIIFSKSAFLKCR